MPLRESSQLRGTNGMGPGLKGASLMSENQATTATASQAGPAPGTGDGQAAEFDAVIVGAGFSGLYMLHSLRELGLSVRGQGGLPGPVAEGTAVRLRAPV